MTRQHALAVSCLLLATWAVSSRPVAQELPPPVHRPRVRVVAPQAAAQRVPIIVGVRTPFAPEGELAPIAAAAQRDTLRAAQAAVTVRLAGLGVGNVHHFESIPFIAMEVDATALAALSSMPEVDSVVEDIRVPAALADSTEIIKATTAWLRGYSGTGWAVSIIDTGVQKSHPMLSGKVISEACYAGDGNCPGGGTFSTAAGSGEPCAQSSCGHGTHVAGIAAGNSGTLFGVARGAFVVAIQVFRRDGLTYTSDMIKGLERTLTLSNDGVKIAAANMSLGGGGYTSACDSVSPATKAAIDNLRSVGIATVIASGNDGYSNSVSFPACISTAISVGSTDKSDQVSYFSNSGSALRLLAPGQSIRSAVPGGGFENWNGTSMATPHVAGAWAVLKQAYSSASVTDVYDALASSGKSITHPSSGLVRPRIDVNAAIDTFDPGPRAAELTTPSPGSTLSGTTVTFQWDSGKDVSEYFLYVGTTPGGHDLYNSSQGTAQTRTVSALPADGQPVYVRLYSKIAGAYRYRDYRFTAATAAPAAITSPLPGATLSSTSATFTWGGGIGVTEYYLYVGSTFEGYDLYQASQGSSTSRTVTGLPADGRPLHVTLWSRISGTYQKRHYQFAAVDGRAVLQTPAPGSTLSGSTETFFWSAGTGVTEYYLYVGSTLGGYDLYEGSQGTSQWRELVGLPTDGRTIYIRIWSKIDGAFRTRDFTVRAATLAPAPATITSPAPGSALLSSSATFQWTSGVGVTQYYLYVGTTPGGYEIYEGSQGTSRSRAVSGLPTDGRPVYVTLWSRINGAYQTRQVSYVSADGRAAITSPTPGSSLSGSNVTFQWTAGLGVSQYYLYVGSSPGGYDIYEANQGTNRSAVVSGIPTDGRTIWVRLWSKIDGVYRVRDHAFTAAR